MTVPPITTLPLTDTSSLNVPAPTTVTVEANVAAPPTDAQLNNFFFGDNVGPSTKGTRKDAFFRGIAQKLLYDIAPDAARKSGRPELEIVKMAAKLNVNPTIKFSNSEIINMGNSAIDILSNTLFNLETKGINGVLTKGGAKKVNALKTFADVDQLVLDYKKYVLPTLPFEAWFGPARS